MNSRERFLAICRNEEYDRLYLGEFGYWCGTLERWYKEGLRVLDDCSEHLPSGRGVAGEFLPFRYGFGRKWAPGMRDTEVGSLLGFDKGYEVVPVCWEMMPLFEEKVLEENDDNMILVDHFGVVKEQGKDFGSIARYLSYPVKDKSDFDDMMGERFRTDNISQRYPKWWDLWKERNKDRDHPVGLSASPFGIFSCVREWMGLENYFITLVEDPEFIDHMLDTLVDFYIALWDDVLGQIDVDYVHIWEDMCYNHGPLISPRQFEKHMLPRYKRLTSFLSDHGIDIVMVDTDGDAYNILQQFQDGGVKYMFPMEVAAGMDITKVRQLHPDLVIGGGIDKRAIAKGKDAIDRELDKVKFMLKDGRYFAHVDHLVDPEVSWENFLYYRRGLRKLIEDNAKSKDLHL